MIPFEAPGVAHYTQDEPIRAAITKLHLPPNLQYLADNVLTSLTRTGDIGLKLVSLNHNLTLLVDAAPDIVEGQAPELIALKRQVARDQVRFDYRPAA